MIFDALDDAFFGGAEKDAANAEANAINAGADRGIQAISDQLGFSVEQMRQLLGQTEGQFDPFVQQGQGAVRAEGDLLGINGRDAEQRAINNFTESPGQAFLRERAEKSLLRNNAAIGGLGGGNVRSALNEQAVGIAGAQLGERQDRLSNAANRGLSAVGNLGALRTGVGSNIGSLSSNAGANIANISANAGLNSGAALGAGIRGRASGIGSGLSRIAGAFL